ncbi:hypothetical protein WR25_15254 [Diploscapter pachys]|uniref:Uncharacterized protein n=1 Tax=Diploscapter pachys TaxID=2018661 RepID=A0A2A2LUL5_9BILA|nr:hypothetical protein WR25_15254 [Diploscapter pachys]
MVLITDQQVDWLQKYGSRGICIDDTFNSTKYPLKLATLLVVDDFDRGLPAGFLLSRKMTSKEVELLFSVIKALLPDFKPEYFMSDAAEAFRNGFKKNPEHRQVLLTKLNLLLKTNIRKVFFERASELCDYLHQTKEIAFLQYISKYISDANSIASWATFPRTGTPFNTSMYSETWHRLLKTDRLNRKENNRVDYLVHVLLETLDFIKKTHEINVNYHKPFQERRGLATISSRRQQTHSRHRTAVELIRTDGVNVQNRGDGLFQILSSDKVTCYTLRFLICRCNSTRNVHCSECDVCPYSVLCSCVDEKAGVSCKHGHILKIWLDKQNGATINVSDCADQPDTFSPFEAPVGKSSHSTSSTNRSGQYLTEAKECAPLAKSQILDAIQEDSAMLGQLYMAILKCGGDQGSRFTHARSQIRSQIEQMLEAIKEARAEGAIECGRRSGKSEAT